MADGEKQPNLPPRLVGRRTCRLCKQDAALFQALTTVGPVAFIRCPRCDVREDDKP